MLNNIRTEEDLLKHRVVPAIAYYGVHNFGERLKSIFSKCKSVTYQNLCAVCHG